MSKVQKDLYVSVRIWNLAENQFGKLKKEACIKGFIIYDTKKRDIVCIPNYEISLWLSNTLNSILYGNKELADIWRENLISERIIDYEPFKIYKGYSESDKLFVELIEYCVLDILSCTLIDYFSRVNTIKKNFTKR